MKYLKIGTKVKTELGIGIIIGIDLPKSRVWRYGVKLTEKTIPLYTDNIAYFKANEIEVLI